MILLSIPCAVEKRHIILLLGRASYIKVFIKLRNVLAVISSDVFLCPFPPRSLFLLKLHECYIADIVSQVTGALSILFCLLSELHLDGFECGVFTFTSEVPILLLT